VVGHLGRPYLSSTSGTKYFGPRSQPSADPSADIYREPLMITRASAPREPVEMIHRKGRLVIEIPFPIVFAANMRLVVFDQHTTPAAVETSRMYVTSRLYRFLASLRAINTQHDQKGDVHICSKTATVILQLRDPMANEMLFSSAHP
jgi:hypothetical protein